MKKKTPKRTVRGCRLAAVMLCMVFPAVVSQIAATPPQKLLLARVKIELSCEPCLGEIVDVIFTITPLEDVPQMKVIWGRPQKGVEIVDRDTVVYASLSKGETESFVLKVRFISSPVHFGVNACRWSKTSEGGERSGRCTGTHLRRFIIDKETGQFGSATEYRNSKLEFRYDPGDGRWLDEGNPAIGPYNREIIEMMRRLEPALGDSEALCLHSEIYRTLTPPDFRAKWSEQEQRWIQDDVYLYYLRQGWLNAIRDGRLEQWRAEVKAEADKGQEDSELKGGYIQVTGRNEKPGLDSPPDGLETEPVLIWEKEFPAGILDVGFNKGRAGLLCPSVIVTGRSALACDAVYFMDNRGNVVNSRKMKQWATARLSGNGEYVGVLDGVQVDSKGVGFCRIEVIDSVGEVRWRGPMVEYGTSFWVSNVGEGIVHLDEETGEFSLMHGDTTIKLDLSNLPAFEVKGLEPDFKAVTWPGTGGEMLIFYQSHGYPGFALGVTNAQKKYMAFSTARSVYVTDLLSRTMVLRRDIECPGGASLSLSPDGKYLACASMGRSREVFLIDLDKRKVECSFDGGTIERGTPLPQRTDRRLVSVDVANSGRLVVVGERVKNCHVLGKNGETLCHLELPDDSRVVSLALSTEGEFLSVVTAGHHDAFQGKSSRSSNGCVYVYRILHDE